MENQVVNTKEDWKSVFSKKLLRERMIYEIHDIRGTLEFLETYFSELQSELEVEVGDIVSFDPGNGEGSFYVDVSHYLGIQLAYKGENYAVTLSSLVQSSYKGRVFKKEAFIVVRDGKGPVINLPDANGEMSQNEIPLTVAWIDEMVKNTLMNAF